MDVFRKWHCFCTGKPVELSYEKVLEEEGGGGEPYCPVCGASPSADLRGTIVFRDEQRWGD